jgi:uncharacterized membrane protein
VPDPAGAPSIPSIHVEETIRSIAGLHASATQHQRAVDRLTSLLDRASFIAALTILVVSWLTQNCVAGALGYHAVDPPPFA